MDDVFRFLLGQVALCGKAGAYPFEVFGFLESYTTPSGKPTSEDDTFPGVDISAPDSSLLNTTAESAIWSWLTLHPGLYVGRKGQAKELSLDQIRSHNEAAIATCKAEHENDPDAVISSLHCSVSTDSPVLRLYAKEEHIWHAIAGHGVDSSRIPPLDFDCLSVIAQHRDAGVLQPTLVTLTGQDKRSVPLRTQRLCDAGYVVKLPTMMNGVRSSLLILKKFASWTQKGSSDAADQAEGLDPSNQLLSAVVGQTRHGEHEAKIREAFAIVRDMQLVIWDDLKKRLNIYGDGPQARALAVAFRDLENLGIVQRVQAQASQDPQAKFRRCIKLVREPTASELNRFFSVEHKVGGVARAKDPLPKDAQPSAAMRPIPQPLWDASRQLTHIVRDIVDASGAEGATSQIIKDSSVGVSYDRPIDHLLGRLVDSSDTSQPAHLKHLGLRREMAPFGRTNMYIYRSAQRLESTPDLEQSSMVSDLAQLAESSSVGSFGFPPIDKALNPLTHAKFLSQKTSNTVRTESKGSASGLLKTGRPRGRPRKNAKGPKKPSKPTVALEISTPSKSIEVEESMQANQDAEEALTPSQPRASKRQTLRPDDGKSTSSTRATDSVTGSLSHLEQAALIQRPSTGIFVGRFCELTRSGRGRRPKSRLAVMKTPKLLDFAWFTQSTAAQKKTVGAPPLRPHSPINEETPLDASDVVEYETPAGTLLDAAQEQQQLANHDASLAGRVKETGAEDLEVETDGMSTPAQEIERQTPAPSTKATPKTGKHSSVGGNSLAAKRRQIVLEIIHDAGGLYPGGNELWYPFASAWDQYNRGTLPDTRTIRTAVSALLDNGMLRRVTFNFQNRHGILAVKSVLTLPDIEPDDERVKKLQEQMIAADPRLFLPEGVYIAPELRPRDKHAHTTPQQVVRIKEDKVDMQYLPAYLKKRKASKAATDGATPPKKRQRRPSKRAESADISAEGSVAPSTPTNPNLHLASVEASPIVESGLAYQTNDEAVQRDDEADSVVNSPRASKPAIVAKRAKQPAPKPDHPKEPRKTRKPPRTTAKPRRLASLMGKTRQPLPQPTETPAVLRQIRVRGPQSGGTGDGWALRMYIAINLVKMLIGGLEQSIDWEIVAFMLDSPVPAAKIKNRWNHVRVSFKHLADAIQAEVREKVLEGFEDGSLDTIDYADIQNYDWEELLEWTLKRIDPSRFDGSLPKTRAKLDEMYNVNTTTAPSFSRFWADGSSTIPHRRAILHKHAYVEELTPATKHDEQAEKLVLARSWVHAVMCTPDAEYDAAAATAKLALLNERDLIATVKQLRTQQMLTAENKGRIFPGRGFDFSEYYTGRLKKNIEVDQLREAAAFKKLLDSRFAVSAPFHFDLNSRDGAYLALLNMSGHNQITTNHDSSLPKSSTLVPAGYMTRKMDKSRLVFDYEVTPTAQFQKGNPLDLTIEPPRCQPVFDDDGNDTTKIPMWYDLNGRLVPIMWEVARAVVAMQLSIRPWITVECLSDAVKSFLQEFEVELVLRWLVQVGAAAYIDEHGPQVVLREWWWMVLADAVAAGSLLS